MTSVSIILHKQDAVIVTINEVGEEYFDSFDKAKEYVKKYVLQLIDDMEDVKVEYWLKELEAEEDAKRDQLEIELEDEYGSLSAAQTILATMTQREVLHYHD